MAELARADFDAFMREVTGFDPFPWQRRLLDQVLDQGWPELLDLPTGTGKTSTLLVALFALALAPQRSARRIVLVVDRRIIVDQVDGFARRVHAALADQERPVCSELATRLRALSCAGEEPLRVVHLRGGVPRDDSWISAPDQPTIIASTVDQVGSRLLFRGYGVSPGMRPVHAGVLARDTLYLLDEVHLAAAFDETLHRLGHDYASWAERGPVGRPFRVVRMSATPPACARPSAVFGLDDDDRAHPVLARRLEVSRRATLEIVKTKAGRSSAVRLSNRIKVAERACALAVEAASGGARAVGVVVNRVDTARRIAARLTELERGQVLLITGRMRPYERRAVEAELERCAAAGAELGEHTSFVVATSCIEAGADLDFDALITEAASLDALRQRFGRLNRLGRHARAPAWILARKDQLGGRAPDDPIYGAALRETWTYLDEIATREGKTKHVDFGLSAFVEPPPQRREALLPTRAGPPLMFPSYLDMWSETRPAPHPDPDPALWLHGKDARVERDVSLVFRVDLPPADDARLDAFVHAREALEFLLPVAEEAVSVPLDQLRTWLGESARVWRWTASELEAVAASELVPGDTVVVPASCGGLGAGTWDPGAIEPVEDVAERAYFETHGRRRAIAKLRLDPRVLPASLCEGLPVPTATDDPEQREAERDACLAWLDRLADRVEQLPPSWRPLGEALTAARTQRTLTLGYASEGASGRQIWWLTVAARGHAIEATTEDVVSVFSGVEVGLAEHLEDVEAWAGQFASRAGLSRELAEDLALAGLLHDLGKADLRFQALLRGGDPIRAASEGPLAKSRQFGSAQSRARAQRRSGWPGLRHELISLALLDASPKLRARAHDLELVRHLVASHHGWCRPWAPTTVDPKPQRVRVELGGVSVEVSTAALDGEFLDACAGRFRRLCRRYGWHGLAYLEALLRLGDHRASATPGIRPEELS